LPIRAVGVEWVAILFILEIALKGPEMKLFTIGILIVFVLLFSSCTKIPVGTFKAINSEGKPFETDVTISSSEYISLRKTGDDTLGPFSRILKGRTNAKDGVYSFSYRMARQTSWIKRLFGADRIPLQKINVEYQGEDNQKYEFTFELYAKR